jgi:hypothetical protein
MAPFHAELRKLVAKHKARIQKAHAARTKKKGK